MRPRRPAEPPSEPSEAGEFREAVKDVRPLKPRAAPLPRPRPPARALFTRRDERRVLEESLELAPGELLVESGDELVFRRAQVSARLMRRLKRGEFAVGDEIDLHGLGAEAARIALRAFLADAIRRRLGCVRVIHGKGLRSGPAGPVLKHAVNIWLRKVDAVLAFTSAPHRDGGTGALYVLLAR
jgi:DNA-nicking Smr family endonuclease